MANATRVMPMLSVADMVASMRFYQEVLGGQRGYQFPETGNAVFLTLRFGDTEIGIGQLNDKPMHGIPQRPATGHRIELCINVPDADATVAALNATGARTVMPPVDLPWGERSAYVEDPDGNLVMLAAPARG